MDIIGIDISKEWFDSYCLANGQSERFCNDPKGFTAFIDHAPEGIHVIMEATGPYYLQLATWLHERNCQVSVVNPLVIRRYSQMQLSRTKTDAKDAALIARYGLEQSPAAWQPPSKVTQTLKQLFSLREGLLKQQTMLSNQQEAFSQGSPADPLAIELLNKQLNELGKSIEQINHRLEALAQAHYENMFEQLQTIPGIGPRTATMFLWITDGFSKFANSRKLASYVGLCPRVWKSGSSVNGSGHICKLGCPHMRKLLYMCSWTAKKCNPACTAMYERMIDKGKPEKVIKVAIAHKLLRQAFAVGNNNEPFSKEKSMAA